MSDTRRPYELYCIMCGQVNDETQTTTYCTACDGVLSIRYHQASKSIQYPLTDPVEEPLRRDTELRQLSRLSEKYNADIWAKMELQQPTGCFKDRGSYVEVQKALELGADAICLASTGNMAASVAAYASWFRIPCYVFVPENTSEAKMAQATIFNANIIRIKGDFSKCETLCRKFARSGNYYLAGDYVFRVEGQKSFSYELIEQGGVDFDHVVVPVGCGTNFAAIWKGLNEAGDAGLIDRLPQMVAVQPEQSSPVVEGIYKKHKVVKDQVFSLAQAVAASDPVDFYKVLDGIDRSGGHAYTTTEQEILDSLQELACDEGIFCEPASVLPLASVRNHPETFEDRKILLVLTGIGLKDTAVVSRNALSSPVIDNNIDHVIEYIQSGYIELQKQLFGKPAADESNGEQLDDEQQRLLKRYQE